MYVNLNTLQRGTHQQTFRIPLLLRSDPVHDVNTAEEMQITAVQQGHADGFLLSRSLPHCYIKWIRQAPTLRASEIDSIT